MRWRLFVLFISITAAFCFMLLTAVTDYGSGSLGESVLISAGHGQETALLSTVLPTSRQTETPVTAAPGHTLTSHRFDPQLKPMMPHVFVSQSADPVLSRHEHERELRAARNKRPVHRRLRYDDNGWYREEFALVTAYCPCAKCCGTQSPGITSIGKNAWTPGLAADPMYLEYGTRVDVQGYGYSVVDDTGGAMRRHWRRDGLLHIDVRMTYHYEARQWGKKYMVVRIYESD